MPNKNFDPNFNPSPFDDRNKDDLNEMLRECEAKNKEAEKQVSKVIDAFFDMITGKSEEKEIQILKKKNEWPLFFFTYLKNKNLAVFQSTLRRDNKDCVLSFAYDWLVEYKLIRVEILKEEFVVKFWNDNFEHIII